MDLREASEADSTFIAEASRRGFRYIALPISLKTIDREHLARFNFELSLGDARPLYFFDGDGDRAGTLWYLRRVTVDRVDSQIAHREAEELGLTDQAFWTAATSFLTRPEGARPAVNEPAARLLRGAAPEPRPRPTPGGNRRPAQGEAGPTGATASCRPRLGSPPRRTPPPGGPSWR